MAITQENLTDDAATVPREAIRVTALVALTALASAVISALIGK